MVGAGCRCLCRTWWEQDAAEGAGCCAWTGSGVPKPWHPPALLLNLKRGDLLVTATAARFSLALLDFKQKSSLLLSLFCSGGVVTKWPSQGFPVKPLVMTGAGGHGQRSVSHLDERVWRQLARKQHRARGGGCIGLPDTMLIYFHFANTGFTDDCLLKFSIKEGLAK